MTQAIWVLGIVLAVEGLALALAPSRILQVLAWLAGLPPDRRRLLGLAVLAGGVGLMWLARALGA